MESTLVVGIRFPTGKRPFVHSLLTTTESSLLMFIMVLWLIFLSHTTANQPLSTERCYWTTPTIPSNAEAPMRPIYNSEISLKGPLFFILVPTSAVLYAKQNFYDMKKINTSCQFANICFALSKLNFAQSNINSPTIIDSF